MVDRLFVPSELSPAPNPGLLGSEVSVGGRVGLVAPGMFALHDAFGFIEIVTRAAVEVETGDLVVVRGRLDGSLHEAAIIERTRPVAGASMHDVERFCHRGVAAKLVARARALSVIRAFFDGELFVEVETPISVPSPGLDTHLDAFELTGQSRYLITSPEYQMKRLLVGGVRNCFQVARCFRRGELGARHNPEFTMLEWYRAFAAVDSVIADTERIATRVVAALSPWRPSASELTPLTLEVDGRHLDLTPPWPRMPVARAFSELAGVAETDMLAWAQSDEERFFRVLIDVVEPALAAQRTPVVLHRYPAPMASLSRLCPDDPRYAERFEVYVAGVELCNGFGELTDASEQRRRLEADQRTRAAMGLPVYPIDERFVAALAAGMPPSAGNALGLDRLIALALGRTDIGEVIAFPDADL